jgi:hypothetical protein
MVTCFLRYTIDPEIHTITKHYEQTKCFTKYERTFVKAVPRENPSQPFSIPPFTNH